MARPKEASPIIGLTRKETPHEHSKARITLRW
jgi:hypothetical protein